MKQITPGHLLTHTSGLPRDDLLRQFFVRELLQHSDSPRTDRQEIIRSLHALKLAAKPGEKYAYSNLGYVVLGAIVDKRGKSSWEEQLEKKLFGPLKIKKWGLGGIGKKDAVEQPWSHNKDGEPQEPHSLMDMPPVMNSAGRIHIALADYQLFLAEMLRLGRDEKGLLKQATAQKMFTNLTRPVHTASVVGWASARKQTPRGSS